MLWFDPETLQIVSRWRGSDKLAAISVYLCTANFLHVAFTSYLLIVRCLVAVAEQLWIQVLILVEEVLKLILLGKRGRKETV